MSNQQLPSNQDFGKALQSELTADLVEDAPRVIVVDDDPGIQLLMRETLTEVGFNVATADSGAEAIDVCLQFEPDLVLLDINMPVMDGIVACAEIRKIAKRDFPIIMVTSVDDAVSIRRAFDAGANDFILKPINWELFQRRLDMVLAEWRKSQELSEHTQRVRVLVKVAPEQVMLVSKSGLIIEDLKQRPDARLPNEESQIQTLEEFFGAEIAHRFKQRISGVLKTGRHNNLDFAVIEHGERRHYEAQFLVDGRERVIIVVQNVDVEKGTHDDVYDLAFYDPTTNLPNRNLFDRIAEDALAEAGMREHSLVFINLQFDVTCGEDMIDEIFLQMVAGHFRGTLNSYGNILPIGKGENAAPISRTGANQFMFVLRSTENDSNVSVVCRQIAKELAEPIESDVGPITLSPRLGAAAYPADGRDLETLMHAANAAAHEARKTGKTLCFNSQAVATKNIDMLDYGNELRRAMDDGQLELHFQPRFSMPGGNITCVEALVRWNHPMRGFVGVAELLQLAKTTGLIVPLGDWVLRAACEKALSWPDSGTYRVSVNLSQQEFTRQDLAERVIETLDQTGLAPHRIDLEFTEEALLRTGSVLADLEKLKSIGVGLVLDDFGIGHTSLAHLKHLPIDALKIDGSFVRNLPGVEADAAICEVIITLAHKLGMKAVAEGVETQEQLSFLQALGCDEFQGFHFCKPLSATEIDDFLSRSGTPVQ